MGRRQKKTKTIVRFRLKPGARSCLGDPLYAVRRPSGWDACARSRDATRFACPDAAVLALEGTKILQFVTKDGYEMQTIAALPSSPPSAVELLGQLAEG